MNAITNLSEYLLSIKACRLVIRNHGHEFIHDWVTPDLLNELIPNAIRHKQNSFYNEFYIDRVTRLSDGIGFTRSPFYPNIQRLQNVRT